VTTHGRAGRLVLEAFVLGAIALLILLPLPGLAAPAPAGGGGSGGLKRVPSSIDATGATDVTERLQRFFDSVPDGSTIVFPQQGRYRVEGTLALRERERLTFDGNGSTIFATTQGERNRSQWTILSSSRLVFRDLVVQGAHPGGGTGDEAYREDLAFQHGFNILGARGIELDHVTVTDVYGDFVYMSSLRGGGWSRNIWIHDSSFARNGRQGISVTAGRNIVIERNSIGDTRRSTIDLEPNSAKGGANHVFILNNRVGDGRLLFVASHGNGPVDDIVISNNLLSREMSINVKAAEDRRARWWVTGNTASSASQRAPIFFNRVDGVVVRANIQPVTGEGAAGVGLDDVCGAVVDGNNFRPSTLQATSATAPCAESMPQTPPQPPAIRGRT
jgi:Right handed beta helix region